MTEFNEVALVSKCCSACGTDKPRAEFYVDKCKNDGLASRCKPCSRLHSRAWYVTNKERAKVTNDAWRAANRDRVRANLAAYGAAHPERQAAANAKYYANNAEKVKAKAAKWAAENPEKMKQCRAAYRAKYPEKAQAIWTRYRARKRGCIVGGRKPYIAFVKWARTAAAIPCYWCHKRTKPGKRHLDHIIPIALGGADAVENLCVACPRCNQRKNKKLPEEFTGQAELRFA